MTINNCLIELIELGFLNVDVGLIIEFK